MTVVRHSDDYWLPHTECPACEAFDHAHCDPDRQDCPTLMCECRRELMTEQREAGDS